MPHELSSVLPPGALTLVQTGGSRSLALPGHLPGTAKNMDLLTVSLPLGLVVHKAAVVVTLTASLSNSTAGFHYSRTGSIECLCMNARIDDKMF